MWLSKPGDIAHLRFLPAVAQGSGSCFALATGDVLASLTRDVDRIEVVYAHTFAPVVAAIVAPLVAVVTGGVLYGWFVVAIPAVILVVLIVALLVIGTRASLDATHEMLGVRRELAAHFTDSVFGAAEIVGYGRQSDRIMQMARLDADIATGSAKARRYAAMRRASCVAATMGIVAWVSVVGVSGGVDGIGGVCFFGGCGFKGC